MAGTTKAQISAARKAGQVSNLKANGAKASTTSNGVTTYYKTGAMADGGASNVLKQTKVGSNEAITPVITPNSLAKKDVPTIPPPPAPVNPGSIVQTNSALGAGLADFGYTVDQNGQFVQKPQAQDPFTDIFKQYMANQPELPNQADMYAQLEKANQLKQKQADVNNYTAQLNAITANSQAEQLKLEGQGRGQTSGFIGGEQARINREAAIAALPVQAQLAAAQGNLEMAQQHVDRMFQIMSQDALAQYQYKTKVVDSFFQFANAQQQRQLDQLNLQESRKYDMQKTNMSLANDWAKTAIQYGQSGLAGRIMALDPKSASFSTDLAKLQGQVSKPMEATGGKRDTQFDKDGNLVDMQTGEVIRAAGGAGGAVDARTYIESQNKLNSLLNYSKQAMELSGSSGLGLWNRAASFLTGDSDYNRLANVVDTMKTNLLTLNTDPAIKKFFGPQMSNRDTELMVSAGSTLNAEKQSPADMQKEIKDYQGFIQRAKGWTYLGNGGVLQVTLKDPATNQSQRVTVDYDTLSQAVNDGLEVIF